MLGELDDGDANQQCENKHDEQRAEHDRGRDYLPIARALPATGFRRHSALGMELIETARDK